MACHFLLQGNFLTLGLNPHLLRCRQILYCWATREAHQRIAAAAAAAAKSHQSCPTLCDPREGSPPGSPVPGILQARTLEWAAISFSNAWKWKLKGKSLSHVWLLATPWTAAYQAPPSMGFSRQEYWSGVPLPSPHQCIGFSHFCPYLAPNKSTSVSFIMKVFIFFLNRWLLKERKWLFDNNLWIAYFTKGYLNGYWKSYWFILELLYNNFIFNLSVAVATVKSHTAMCPRN